VVVIYTPSIFRSIFKKSKEYPPSAINIIPSGKLNIYECYINNQKHAKLNINQITNPKSLLELFIDK